MQFGFTLKPDHSIERTLALARQAEAAGFDYGWLFDSHVLWREPYPLLTLIAQAHDAAAARHLRHEPGDPRAVGHGVDARRARRAVGRADGPRHRPRRLGPPRPRQAADLDGGPRGGRARHPRPRRGPLDRVRGHELELPWTAGWTLPGLGRRLRPGGAQDDRPDRRRRDAPDRRPGPGPLVRRPGPRRRRVAAGRDPAGVKVQAAAPAHVGDRADGRERTRWFPALVATTSSTS